jgi:hypothetical protein
LEELTGNGLAWLVATPQFDGKRRRGVVTESGKNDEAALDRLWQLGARFNDRIT